LSHERLDIAGAEGFHSPEGNMCGTAMRGADALPGSKATMGGGEDADDPLTVSARWRRRLRLLFVRCASFDALLGRIRRARR
jgi:hypothetical protein